MGNQEKAEKGYEDAKKKVQQFSDSLNANKNLAQTTAAWAMSIVHISLLKAIIDRSASEYFYPNVILISIAIFFQVIVGMLTLIVGNINKYYSTFHDADLLRGGKMCTCCGGNFTICAGLQNNYFDISNADISRALGKIGEGSDLFSVISDIEKRIAWRMYTNLASDTDIAKVKIDKKTTDFILEKLDENDGKFGCWCKRVGPSYDETVTVWYKLWNLMKTRSNTVLIEKDETRNAELSKLRSYERKIDVCNAQLKAQMKNLSNNKTLLKKRTTSIKKFQAYIPQLSNDVNGNQLLKSDKAAADSLKDIKGKCESALNNSLNAEILSELKYSVKQFANIVKGIFPGGNAIETKIIAQLKELEDINQEEQQIVDDKILNEKRSHDCNASLLDMSIKITQTEEAHRIMAEHGNVLEEAVDIIHQDRVFKTTSRYQRIINYLLYLVFIINAFIAGFGLTKNTT